LANLKSEYPSSLGWISAVKSPRHQLGYTSESSTHSENSKLNRKRPRAFHCMKFARATADPVLLSGIRSLQVGGIEPWKTSSLLC